MNDIYRIIQGPCLTEKGDRFREEEGKAVIKVHPQANKIEIKEAVEKIFKVKVASVRTGTMPGKLKRLGRYSGYTPGWKKAYITLKEGKIDFLEDL